MDPVHQEQTDSEIMTEFFQSLDRCLSSGHRFTLFGDDYIHAYNSEVIVDNEGKSYSPLMNGVYMFATVETKGAPDTERPIFNVSRDDFMQYIFNNHRDDPVSTFKAESDKMRFFLFNTEEKERIYFSSDEELYLGPR